MKTQFILPAGIALGAHALLLLGFTDRPEVTPRPEAPRAPDPIPVVSMPPEDELPPIEDFQPDEETPPPLKPPPFVDPVPISDPSSMTTITEPLRPKPPGDPDHNLNVIPTDWQRAGEGNRSWGALLSDRDLDNQPRALYQPAPDYPAEKRTEAANVIVEFVVARDGTVANARIVSSSDHAFEESCLRAVRRWRFEPGLKGGVPVPFRVSQPFVFHRRD